MIAITCLLTVSCLLWAANAIMVVLSYWTPQMLEMSFVLFAAVIVEFFIMLHLSTKNGMGYSVIHEDTPKVFTVLVVVSLIYTFINGVICMLQLWEGGPEMVDGVYCLWNHGFIREITKAEYEALRLVESRLSTGHLIVFSAAPMSVFSTLRERKILQKYMMN